MISPNYLQKGDTICIAAPAGRVDRIRVAAAVEVLESWGLKVKLGKHVLESYFNFASTDENRLQDFQRMLDDPSVKAILCARGGYGSNRIIDRLDFDGFVKNPKWIIGFSDITVIHNHIQQHFGIETMHGSMAAGLHHIALFPETAATLRKVLFGEKLNYVWPLDALSKKGQAEGVLTGGNLAILCTLIGTPSETDTNGKILFIEEIGENLYRIDRMITQLRRAGKLNNLAGLIVGGMTDIPDKKEEFGKNAFEIVLDAVKDFDYPVAFDFPAGHQDDNRALILGRSARLEVAELAQLDFSEI